MQNITIDTNIPAVSSPIPVEREYVDKERRTVKLNESDKQFLTDSIRRNIDVFNRLKDK